MTQTNITNHMTENSGLINESGYPTTGKVRIKFRNCELVRLARKRYPEFDFNQILELELPRKDLLTYELVFLAIERYLGEHLEVYVKNNRYWITWTIKLHYDVLNLDEIEETFGDYYEVVSKY